jgi:hypothetical protein
MVLAGLSRPASQDLSEPDHVLDAVDDAASKIEGDQRDEDDHLFCLRETGDQPHHVIAHPGRVQNYDVGGQIMNNGT